MSGWLIALCVVGYLAMWLLATVIFQHMNGESDPAIDGALGMLWPGFLAAAVMFGPAFLIGWLARWIRRRAA